MFGVRAPVEDGVRRGREDRDGAVVQVAGLQEVWEAVVTIPYPPNPPENPPHPFIPGSPGWLAYERGRAAADSWWRSRLVSNETVEAVAQAESFRGGPCLCSRCNDERADVRHLLERVLASLLPVTEKPETDT